MDKFYTYILSNQNNTVLYVGFTNNLKSRLNQHKAKSNKGFSGRYNIDKLVWFESSDYANNSVKREKQIKKWNRQWKINLINDINPDWLDLSWMLD